MLSRSKGGERLNSFLGGWGERGGVTFIFRNSELALSIHARRNNRGWEGVNFAQGLFCRAPLKKRRGETTSATLGLGLIGPQFCEPVILSGDGILRPFVYRFHGMVNQQPTDVVRFLPRFERTFPWRWWWKIKFEGRRNVAIRVWRSLISFFFFFFKSKFRSSSSSFQLRGNYLKIFSNFYPLLRITNRFWNGRGEATGVCANFSSSKGSHPFR